MQHMPWPLGTGHEAAKKEGERRKEEEGRQKRNYSSVEGQLCQRTSTMCFVPVLGSMGNLAGEKTASVLAFMF